MRLLGKPEETRPCPVHQGNEFRARRGMANGIVAPHCSWDGSLDPDVFMDLLTKPGTELTPTDKNYKVYISVLASTVGDDPHELKPMVMGSGPLEECHYKEARRPNRRERKWLKENGYAYTAERDDSWVVWGERGARREDKFYFEHLSTDQRKEFVRMLNAKELTLNYPGHFYRLPFFIGPA